MKQGHSCVKIVPPRDSDFIKGVNSPLQFKSVLPSANWKQYFHFMELQKIGGLETDGCVIFSAAEIADAQIDYQISTGQITQQTVDWFASLGFMDSKSDDGKPHFHSSPRFWGVLTGNKDNGNALTDPWDAGRKYGCIPWADLPFDGTITTLEQYYAPIPQNLLDKGQVFLAGVGGKNWIQYHWLWNKSSSIAFPVMDADREQAPLHIAVYAGAPEWNQTVPSVPPPNSPPCHSVTNDSAVQVIASGEEVLDHYLPFFKTLSDGYPVPQVLQAIVSINPPPPAPVLPANPTVPQTVSWLSQVASWLRNILESISPDSGRLQGQARSSKWPSVEKAFLKLNPNCKVCNAAKNLNVHHVKPFHIHPELELEPSNLTTLCRDHHFLFGHLMNWASYNENVRIDSVTWNAKIKGRP